MKNMEIHNYHNRLLVGELIEKVLLGKMSVLEAVSSFPKDNEDINIKCAFDALIHREADEDLRKNTSGYKEVQDEYLHDLSCILKENRELPQNIISEYLKYHSDNLISPKENNFKNTINKIKRMINL